MDEFEAVLAAERGAVGARVRHPRDRMRNMNVGARIKPRMVGARAERVDSLDEPPVEYTGTEYIAGENTFFAIPPTTVAANSTIDIGPINPDRPIEVQRFIVPSTLIDLRINQFTISGTPLLPSTNGVNVVLFSEVSTAPNIDWLTIQTSPGVTIRVTNPTGNPLTFEGAFYGTQLRM